MIYVVRNSYQGVHWLASSREGAQEYVDMMVAKAPKGSVWVREHWSIIDQPLDNHPILQFDNED